MLAFFVEFYATDGGGMEGIMLCENCNKNDATIHYTEIMNGAISEHHICSECAKELDLSYYSDGLSSELPFAKLLTGLLASKMLLQQESNNPMTHVICPKCGMNYDEFTKVGKFGCAECYNVFGPLIEEHMKKLHGNSVHTGKQYRNPDHVIEESDDMKKDLEILNAKLKEAIKLENYEEAAQYRDEIKEIKEIKETKDTKEIKEAKETKETTETKEMKDTKESKETKEIKERNETNE